MTGQILLVDGGVSATFLVEWNGNLDHANVKVTILAPLFGECHGRPVA